MDTNGQRKGFGFDKFFRRISRSSEGTPDAKKNSKNGGYDVAAQVGSVELGRTSGEKTISKIDDEEKIDQPEILSKLEKTDDSEETKETNGETRDKSKKLSRMKSTRQSEESKRMVAEESQRKSPKRKKRSISEDIKRPDEESKDDFGKLSKMQTPRESKESRGMDEEPKRYSRKLSRREKPKTSVISQQNEKHRDDSRKSSRMDKLRTSQETQRMIVEPEDNRKMSSRVEELRDSEGSKKNDEEREGHLREPSKIEELSDSKEIDETIEAPYDYSRNSSGIEKRKDFEDIKKTDEELKDYPRKLSKKQKPKDSEVSKKMEEDQEEYSRKSSIMEKRRDSELSQKMDEEQDRARKSSRMEKPKDLEVSEQRDQESKGHSRKSSLMQKPRDSEASKKMNEEQEEYSRKSSRTEEPRDSEATMKIGEGSKDYSRKSSKMQKLRGSVMSKGTNEEAKDYSRKSSIMQKIRDSDASKRTSKEQEDYPRNSQITPKVEKPTDFELTKKMTPEPKGYSRKSSKMEKGVKDEGGQGLSELINNSIKEAVMNIVKVGVCSPTDSLVAHEKDVSKLIPLSIQAEVHQGKEKKPAISNNLLPPMAAIPRRSSSYGRSASDRRHRESHPRVIKDQKAKSIIKRREKKPSEASGKVPCQTKANGHFKTDNRRMTGNVNIYICSEATERTQEPSENEKENDQDFEESETSSNVKTSNSSLSASTSKLLAALRKKKLENPKDQLLGRLCETSEDSAGHRFVDNIDNNDDELSCLCDDKETEFPDSESFSSRDVCFCEDSRKFDDEDDYVSSVAERKSNREKPRPRSTYNRNYPRYWTTANTPNYVNNWMSIKTKAKANISKKDFGEGCSCCDHKRCRRDRTIGVQRRKTWRTLPETRVRKSSDETHKFPCIIEEEAESCCDKKTCQENYVFCTKRPVNDAPSNIKEEDKNRELSPCRYEPLKFEDNGSPKRETMIHRASSIVQMRDVVNPVNDKDNGESAMRKSHECNQVLMDVSPKRISAEDEGLNDSPKRNSTEEEPLNPMNQETDEKPEYSPRNSSQIETVTPSMFPDGRRKSSFLRRSIGKLMSIVRVSRVEETLDTEDDRESAQPISIPQLKPQDIDDPVTSIEKTIQLPLSSTRLSLVPQKTTVETRSKSRISTAIAKRKSLAAMSKSTLQSRASPLLGTEVDDQQDERKSRWSSIKAQQDRSQEEATNGSFSPNKEHDDCQDERRNGSFSMKTREDDRESKNLCESLDYQLPIVQNQLCKCSVPQSPNIPSIECSKTIETRVSPSADKDFAGYCDWCVGRNGSVNESNCQCESDWMVSCCCFTNETKLEKLSKDQEHPKPEDFGTGIHQRFASLQEHGCCQRCRDLNVDGPKSMICVYCDNQREKCICKVASQKCSRSSTSLEAFNWNRHQMVYPGDIGEPAMSGSEWTSRDFWRGFSKATAECEDDIDREETSRNSKPYGAEDLPYQKGTAFSNVMNELQQRISGSVCCNGCGMVPYLCRCRDEETKRTVDTWPRLSTMKEVKTCTQKRSRSKSPINCKCVPIPRRKTATLQSAPMRICDRCNTSPCRCRRNGGSPPTVPQAKCYYCKRWPCACSPMIAASKARPIRNVDSSIRRTRERSDKIERTIESRINNENNGRFVPCVRRLQIRKYCYSDNPNGSKRFDPGERVR